MKKIYKKIRVSKFKNFIIGLIFAIISFIAISLCIADLQGNTVLHVNILIMFFVAIIHLILGFLIMIKENLRFSRKTL